MIRSAFDDHPTATPITTANADPMMKPVIARNPLPAASYIHVPVVGGRPAGTPRRIDPLSDRPQYRERTWKQNRRHQLERVCSSPCDKDSAAGKANLSGSTYKRRERLKARRFSVPLERPSEPSVVDRQCRSSPREKLRSQLLQTLRAEAPVFSKTISETVEVHTLA